MNAVHDSDRRIAAFLDEGTEVLPDWVLDSVRDQVDATPQRRARWPKWRAVTRSNAWRLGLVAALLFLGLGLALVTRPNVATKPPQPSPAVWSGPLRAGAGGMPIRLMTTDPDVADATWTDGPDAAVPGIDISTVRWRPHPHVNWSIDLGGWPPRAEDLDPGETIIAYGVVLDTNGDRVADYEFGIDNDAPLAGDYRTWLTDLAAGHTHDRAGGPYGYPVEFAHPDGQDPNDTFSGQPQQPSMLFTLLPGARPFGPPDEVFVSDEWQFYVWATVTEGGEVVVWDYAPDFGWLTLPSP